VGVISRLYNFVTGTTIDSEQVDAEFNQILAVLNGSIDPANLSAASKNTFLKLASAADRKVVWGTSDNSGASWGLTADRDFNIAHGQGVAPQWWIAWGTTAISTASGADPTVVSRLSDDATNLRVRQSTLYRGTCNFAGANVYWIGIF
jgi:hypothetical protein